MDRKICIIAIAILLIGCTGNVVREDSLKIGVLVHLTGVGSEFGMSHINGMELAVSELNKHGGINEKNVKLIIEDNQGDNPKVGVTVFHKFVDTDRVKFIIGPMWTPTGNALAPLAAEEDIVMISHSLGGSYFNEYADNLFNIKMHDTYNTDNLAQFVFDNGDKKVAVLGSLQAWEKEQAERFSQTFESLGGEIVSLQLPSQDDQELRLEIAKIIESEPDAVVLTNMGQEAIAAKRLREKDPNIQLYSVLLDPYMLEIAASAFEGAVVVTDLSTEPEFVSMYENAYGESPQLYADSGYDAVMLLAKAMKETNSEDPMLVKDYLNSLEDYDGMSGYMRFDGKGGVVKKSGFQIVKDKELVWI